MNRLEDMMEHYDWNDDTMIPDKTLDSLEKERILNRTLEKAGLSKGSQESQPRRQARSEAFRPRRSRKMWPVAVACAMVLTMATISFAAMALDKSFFDFFHADSQDQKEILGSIGTVIGKQVSDNGLTLDVREAVGDGNTVNVLFDVIAPEGMALDQNYYSFSTAHVDLPKNPSGSGGYYFEILPDDDPADNRLTMMLCYSAEKNISGSTMRFQFTDLTTPKLGEELAAIEALPPMTEPGTPGDEYDVNKIVVAGNWNIEFPLEYFDASKTLKLNTSVELCGGECKMKELRYSPLSVSLVIEGDSIAEYDSLPPDLADGQSVDSDGANEIIVKLKDGTVVNSNGASTGISGKTLTVTCSFSTLIDTADIESVSYAGVDIPVQK